MFMPRKELAAGRLFPALWRVRELDLFDFGVFGEEAFNGRRLHAWAARTRPTCRERDAPDGGGKYRGVEENGEGPTSRASTGRCGSRPWAPTRTVPGTKLPAVPVQMPPTCPGAVLLLCSRLISNDKIKHSPS